jgi:stearoyl-CoA desaturase (delta-9 desaturase)
MIAFIYTLVMVQITIACVTLYLHRSMTHRAVKFHSVIEHLMRFHLWMTTGMNTREWVAVHRAHHQYSDTERDPHSPKVYGIWRVLFMGWKLYVDASKDKKMVRDLGVGTPDDWIERRVYTPHPYAGILLMLVIDCLLFGPGVGFIVWGVQMIWIPFWAAGVINGICHHWGYRNVKNGDSSRNLWPWAVWIGGEELHANHHDNGTSAKFSQKPWEFDIGWMYIRILKFFGLAKLRGQ